jgi:Ca-activated chloride channel family protein
MDDSGKDFARRIIEGIEADGGTNMSAALEAARDALAGATPREGAMRQIVLLSDGQANEGIIGPGLIQLASSLTQQKLRLSALGLGLDFDENTMLALADAGRGQYRYLRNADEVASALTQELSQAASTAATGLTLTLAPADGVSIREVVSYDTARDGTSTRVGLSDLASGELRRVVVRVRASSGAPGAKELIRTRLTYEDARSGHLPKSLEAMASAEATTSSARVSNSYDKEAAKDGLRARWAGSLLNVARDFDQDGSVAAQKSLDDGFRAIEAEARAIGDDVLNEELAQQNLKISGDMRAAPASREMSRGFSKSLKQFGVENAR